MELFIDNIPYAIDEVQLHRELTFVLRGPSFRDIMGGEPCNFLVRLFPRRGLGQWGHSGRGILVVPAITIGQQLLDLAESNPTLIHGRRLYVRKSRRKARLEDLALLEGPYRDPETLEGQEQLSEMKEDIILETLQFGWPCQDGGISIEWESPTSDAWRLEVDSETRRFIINSQSGLKIVVTRNNLRAIAYDSNAVLLLLERPPIFEREKRCEKETQTDPSNLSNFFADIANIVKQMMDSGPGPSRDRVVSLDDNRDNIFAFLRVIRVTFDGNDALREFQRRAKSLGHRTSREAYTTSKQGLFDPNIMKEFRTWLSKTPLDVAFQIDALTSSSRFNPKELLEMRSKLSEAIEAHGEATICDCIQQLGRYREADWLEQSDADGRGELYGETSSKHPTASSLFVNALLDLSTGYLDKARQSFNNANGVFCCHRVAVTPTSLILTGPLPDETNRVLRKYIAHQSNFLRVEFRDEDLLPLHFDREVDSSKFIDELVGGTLQRGLVLAGRRFEFLAYSSSALKEHAVWFINPFIAKNKRVDAESIRISLGDFSKVIKYPALYGARIAQAFSSTEPSITISSNQRHEIPDIEPIPGSLFTDGVGKMSSDVANEIWKKITEPRSKRRRSHRLRPSAFQIRLGGLKGMLCVDERLTGRVIETRPSMNKFVGMDQEVEIVKAFDRPMPVYLNRPLVMLLETLGVPLKPFRDLQDAAVEKTQAASESMKMAAQQLEIQGLGTALHIPSILLNLHKLSISLVSAEPDTGLISFLKRTLKFAENHVLRDFKFKARIPVPGSWTLVGVVDEYDCLEEGQIFACICDLDRQRRYIKGPVLISRSPTSHPGDAQMVTAIGEPPAWAHAGLGKLINCVVFSCRGERSMPSMLAGGDLDGDIYCLILDERLHPKESHLHEPASPDPPMRVKLSRPSTVSDITQFVVDFIKNDILGLIATQILLTADEGEKCMAEPDCLRLADLHSIAVDFPKTGRSVDRNDLPKQQSKQKPDWYARETDEREGGFYQSERIIGHLFRAIELPATQEVKRVARRQRLHARSGNDDAELKAVVDAFSREDDFISKLLKGKMHKYVEGNDHPSANVSAQIEEMLNILERYTRDLADICKNRSLPGWNALTEEEVTAGTIVAKCSHERTRSDMIAAMRRESSSLATFVREVIEGPEDLTDDVIVLRAWTAWRVSVASGDVFGARSFGLMALDVIFSTLSKPETI